MINTNIVFGVKVKTVFQQKIIERLGKVFAGRR